jgi:hypothetical protein
VFMLMLVLMLVIVIVRLTLRIPVRTVRPHEPHKSAPQSWWNDVSSEGAAKHRRR